jgi:hypothetical protein
MTLPAHLEPMPINEPVPHAVDASLNVVGTQWQPATTARLLMRRNDFLREIRHTHQNVSMQYEIEAVRQAPAASPFLTGGTLTNELAAWQ